MQHEICDLPMMFRSARLAYLGLSPILTRVSMAACGMSLLMMPAVTMRSRNASELQHGTLRARASLYRLVS